MRNYRKSTIIFFATGLWVLLVTGFGSRASVPEPQQRFEAANNLYNQSKYTAAAGIYQELITEGYNEPSLYFNAGNASYKAGKTGTAIYNYEKALQLSPDNAAVKHNLAIANQKVSGYVQELPLVFFQQWWQQLQHLHRANGWAIGCLIFFWLLVAGFLLNTYLPGWKNKFLRWGNYALGALFLLYVIMAVDAYLIANDHSAGIVMSSNIRAKAAPDDNSKDTFEVGEGMKVQITDATNDFCKITLADGKSGWIACTNIKRL
ncbi:tetratricopeptide repeat protein [Chitinophaga nivalis]|uniref:Tetratricopeptide repeat protein n=1 Tax=Chitinophaga nivalis TaxID=2991709 RepID=A0ABT3IVV5_9BACT|nr:tetratricopeptide repeat protein [Chitinophaga nivalis]MCW3462484.1 tetratricopeptide repeat protein [Chitinophaga nivalis]MCW3487825.1 tetratricopeptide repeat protein [Chitinophaga nivalis]